MNVILLGPPGAGKGTQAQLLQAKYGMLQLSTGDLLRSAIKNGDKFGQEAQSYMDSGNLVPDDLIIRIVEAQIEKPEADKGFILDGFPRTVPQAEALDAMLAKHHKNLDAIIELRVDEAELIERIAGRFTCGSCGAGYNDKSKPTLKKGVCDVCGGTRFTRRADDNPETLKTRFKAYREQTAPILPYYKRKGLLKSVNGMASMAEVSQALNRIINN